MVDGHMGLSRDRPSPTPADLTGFTRFQRMLLRTDGTVTHILETYAEEPIDVVKLLQEFDTAHDVDSALGLPPDEKVLRRQVVLRGRHSGTNLLYAEAVVALAHAEPAFVDILLDTDTPIGVALAQRRTETLRHIVRIGREPAGVVGVHFGVDAASEVASRTYVIVAGGRPLILITEKFPADAFRGMPA
jgi:chorismate-pyruvate lyase